MTPEKVAGLYFNRLKTGDLSLCWWKPTIDSEEITPENEEKPSGSNLFDVDIEDEAIEEPHIKTVENPSEAIEIQTKRWRRYGNWKGEGRSAPLRKPEWETGSGFWWIWSYLELRNFKLPPIDLLKDDTGSQALPSIGRSWKNIRTAKSSTP